MMIAPNLITAREKLPPRRNVRTGDCATCRGVSCRCYAMYSDVSQSEASPGDAMYSGVSQSEPEILLGEEGELGA